MITNRRKAFIRLRAIPVAMLACFLSLLLISVASAQSASEELKRADELVQQAYLLQWDKVDEVSDQPNGEELQEKILDEAKALHKQALAIYLANDALAKAASQYDNLTFVLFGGSTEEKAALQHKALMIHQSLGDKKSAAETLTSLAVLYQFEDREKALNYYSQSISFYEQAGEQGKAIDAIHWVGEFYDELEKPDEAHRKFNKALKRAESLGDHKRVLVQVFAIGDLYDAQERNDDAEQTFRKALSLAEAASDKNGAYQANDKLYSLMLKLKRKEDGSVFLARLNELEPQVDPELVEQSKLWRDVFEAIDKM